MTAIVLIAVLAAVVIGIAAALGAGPLVLVIVPLAIVAVGILAVLGSSRRRPAEVERELPKQEFLGPGGPDDPDR